MSSHEYKGHKIKVEARPGAARPWGVWVDGVELFGSGDRVRRRLAYGTAAAALDAGKRCVRALIAAGFEVHPPAADVRPPGKLFSPADAEQIAQGVRDCRLRELEQEVAAGERRPLAISPDAAKQACLYCGHRRDAHTIPYETNLSMRCAVEACSCVEFTRPPVQPNLYPCGCSRHKVNAGRCDQYKPGEVP